VFHQSGILRFLFVIVGAAALVAASSLAADATGRAPRNGPIAFSTGFLLINPDPNGHSQVFTVNPDGSRNRQLTHVPAPSQAGAPDFSPNGRRIAYISNVSGNFAIWLMRADGRDQHQVIGMRGYDYFQPRWSPDGTRLVFTRCNVKAGFTEYCNIVIANADGSGAFRLVGGHRNNGDASFSPNGRWVVFDSDRAGFQSAVWRIRTNGSGLTRLTPPTVEGFFPSWSPDGRHILFTDNYNRPGSNVFVMTSDGLARRQLTHFAAGHQGGFATYSPNGKRIVLVSDMMRPPNGPDNDLYTMHADGSDLTRIVANHPHVALSDWGAAR
jgi:Tol biopolymer transport system component